MVRGLVSQTLRKSFHKLFALAELICKFSQVVTPLNYVTNMEDRAVVINRGYRLVRLHFIVTISYLHRTVISC